MRQNRGQPDAEQVCVEGRWCRDKREVITESAWPKGDLEAWSTRLWCVLPKTPREPTLSTNTLEGGVLKETRKETEFSMSVGREEKQRRLIHKMLRDK